MKSRKIVIEETEEHKKTPELMFFKGQMIPVDVIVCKGVTRATLLIPLWQ